jgi:hypothetical protein
VVDLGQTVEHLDVCRSLWPRHILDGLDFLGIKELAIFGYNRAQNDAKYHHQKTLLRV